MPKRLLSLFYVIVLLIVLGIVGFLIWLVVQGELSIITEAFPVPLTRTGYWQIP